MTKKQEFCDVYCEGRFIVDWSIADFVRATGINKNDLQDLISDITVREYLDKTVVLNCFDLDYDALYSIAAEKPVADKDPVSVIDKINEDMVFCGREKLNIKLQEFPNVKLVS